MKYQFKKNCYDYSHRYYAKYKIDDCGCNDYENCRDWCVEDCYDYCRKCHKATCYCVGPTGPTGGRGPQGPTGDTVMIGLNQKG